VAPVISRHLRWDNSLPTPMLLKSTTNNENAQWLLNTKVPRCDQREPPNVESFLGWGSGGRDFLQKVPSPGNHFHSKWLRILGVAATRSRSWVRISPEAGEKQIPQEENDPGPLVGSS
jgi:hypothetical protein